jgi:hypothetical protein
VRITDEQRRARLTARHHLDRSARSPEAVVEGVVALHSSDPITPYLAAWARVPGFVAEDLDDALYRARTLARVHAMRRTLFIVPAGARTLFHAAAGRDVAATARRTLLRWLEADMDPTRAALWLTEVEEATVAALTAGDGAPLERSTRDLGEAVPALRTEITVGSGKWATTAPVGSRVLFLLAVDDRLVRTRPAGSWRSSQYRWARTTDWFAEPGLPRDPAETRADLLRRYLAAHGPATLTDMRWWTGWTLAKTRAALAALDVRAVQLDDGSDGLLLAGDEEPSPHAAADVPTVALLPGLDPTAMGWKERSWQLGDHGAVLFDRNGNAGPTIWVDGRMVGGWAQRPDGEVVHRLLEDLGTDARDLIAEQAAALTAWLDGTTARPRFRSPLERELADT